MEDYDQTDKEYIKVLEEQVIELQNRNRELNIEIEYWSNKCENLEIRNSGK
jgi:hypothetical protein